MITRICIFVVRNRILALAIGFLIGCGRGATVTVEFGNGSPNSDSADPPYLPGVSFPSGLGLSLVQDQALTNSYPLPGSNPFGSIRERHYSRVQYFIDLDRAPLSEQVAPHVQLSEFVNPTLQRGGKKAYVDAQIVSHAQQIRSGLGRPLILSSAFRGPEHNQAVGGATFSRHIYGDAVDLDVDQSSGDANLRAQEIFNEARDVGLDFVLPLSETSVSVGGQVRVSWVHVDDRGF